MLLIMSNSNSDLSNGEGLHFQRGGTYPVRQDTDSTCNITHALNLWQNLVTYSMIATRKFQITFYFKAWTLATKYLQAWATS